ncbi:enoyl-CoA hydratase/isomerase family protein [Castellaniella sp.]|uniref:enoyl-CoA hydratase/isomerase family protein n=1 Tax=Castellaniella sp. TaxID=1955812 RepID=UPI003C7559E4
MPDNQPIPTPQPPDSPKILYSQDDGIARIILNRPKQLNALDAEAIHALAAALERACDDEHSRVVLIQGTGKAFCVGGDINLFQQTVDGLPALLDSLLQPLNAAIARVAASGLPIVSAVNGPVGGGGIGLALCADYVLAAQSMALRCGYSAIGLTPDVGSARFLTLRVGVTRAKHLFYLNEMLDAPACLALGIVDAIHPDEELAAAAEALARRLRAGPRAALARIKALVETTGARSLPEHLAAERECMVASAGEPDACEGIAAFTEKRAARFGP